VIFLNIEQQRKASIVLSGLLITSVILLALSIFDLVTGRITQLLINSFALVFNAVAFVALKKYQKLQPVLLLMALILMGYCLLEVYANAQEGVSGLYVTLILPPVFYFLLGVRSSTVLLVPFYVVMVSWSFVAIDQWSLGQWALMDAIRYCAVVCIIWGISASFEFNLAKSLGALEVVSQREKALIELRASELALQLHSKNKHLSELHHDVKNPLNVIQVHIESIEDGLASQQSFSVIGQKLKHVYKLLDGLIHEPTLGLDKQRVDIGELLKESLRAYSPIFEKKGIRVSQDMHLSPVYAQVDVMQLTQVFNNLFDNSIKYTHEGGQFHLELTPGTDQLEVIFSDSSPGPNQDDLLKLTQRGFRVPGNSASGSGLGLHICADIIQAHEGDMRFDVSTLGGLSVAFSLPV